MERAITAFRRDGQGHWLAELECGHTQHTRHHPPQSERPWVLTEASRRERIGTPLDCLRCDRRELPENFAPYRTTRVFDERSLPDALRARHGTRPGVWARIHVSAGRLRYRLHEPFDEEYVLEPGEAGVVLPGVEHEVEPLGAVRFHVEFYRRQDAPATPGA
jgi:tellurite methyltransferase